MSHEIETMFSVRKKPWHYEMTKNYVKLIQEAPTSEEALKAAGLDWEVMPRFVYDEWGRPIPGYTANTRDMDDKVLRIVSDRYQIVQNKDAFDFTDALLEDGMRYETAGSLRGGKQVWLLGQLPKKYIAGDETEQYICFTNTHDGSGAVRVCMTPVRVVCNNTLNLALKSAKRSWSARHTGDINAKLADAKETLMLAGDYMDALAKTANEMALQVMSPNDVEKVTSVILNRPEKPDKKAEAIFQQKKDELMICMLRPDLANFLGTKWGFLNAVADFVDHSEPMRRTKNYDQNNWGKIMGGHPMLDKAFAMVGEMV